MSLYCVKILCESLQVKSLCVPGPFYLFFVTLYFLRKIKQFIQIDYS